MLVGCGDASVVKIVAAQRPARVCVRDAFPAVFVYVCKGTRGRGQGAEKEK